MLSALLNLEGTIYVYAFLQKNYFEAEKQINGRARYFRRLHGVSRNKRRLGAIGARVARPK